MTTATLEAVAPDYFVSGIIGGFSGKSKTVWNGDANWIELIVHFSLMKRFCLQLLLRASIPI
jgi:hypothetical protein